MFIDLGQEEKKVKEIPVVENENKEDKIKQQTASHGSILKTKTVGKEESKQAQTQSKEKKQISFNEEVKIK